MAKVKRLLQRSVVFGTLVLLLIATDTRSAYAQGANETVTAEKVESVETPAFVYSPAGRRDPFVPLIQKIHKSAVKPKKNLGPLEKYELGQFRLLAMLIVKGVPRAMVKAPDGKSYTVKPGDLIGPNGGVVKRIETKVVAVDGATGQRVEKSPDRVVVEEPMVDNFTGKLTTRDSYIEM